MALRRECPDWAKEIVKVLNDHEWLKRINNNDLHRPELISYGSNYLKISFNHKHSDSANVTVHRDESKEQNEKVLTIKTSYHPIKITFSYGVPVTIAESAIGRISKLNLNVSFVREDLFDFIKEMVGGLRSQIDEMDEYLATIAFDSIPDSDIGKGLLELCSSKNYEKPNNKTILDIAANLRQQIFCLYYHAGESMKALERSEDLKKFFRMHPSAEKLYL